MNALGDWLQSAVDEYGIPAAQAVVYADGERIHSSAHGSVAGRPITPDTRFDVASLTKLIATTAVVAALRSERVFDFDDPVADALPLFARNGKGQVTVRQLLAHGSGLPAWLPLFRHAQTDAVASAIYPSTPNPAVPRAIAFDRAREQVVQAALTTPLAEQGARAYSDLGFIALGEWISAVAGRELDAVCTERVFVPAGATATRFFDLRSVPMSPHTIVPTGRQRPREPAPGQEGLYAPSIAPERVDPGEVDDDNAYAMAGVAGHAGVFSTAQDVARIGQTLLDDFGGAAVLARSDVLHEMFAPDTSVTGPVRGLGVDRVDPTGSSAGSRFGQAGPLGAVGHLGFTGCSLWIDLDRRAVAALLTNRVLPGREHTQGIHALRPAFHDAVADLLDHGVEPMEITEKRTRG